MGGPASCLFFGSYESLKVLFKKKKIFKNEMLINFFSGFGAECCSSFLWVPIDVIKERLQVQSDLKIYNYKNSFDAVRQIVKKEKYIGLYRAYGATILAFGPYLGIQLMMYENVKKFLGFSSEKKNIGFIKSFLVAFITGNIAAVITNPLDVPKLRMQVQRAEMVSKNLDKLEKGRFGYKNVFHGIWVIIQKEGVLALWRGCGARILYLSSQAAVNLSLLEKIRGGLVDYYKK